MPRKTAARDAAGVFLDLVTALDAADDEGGPISLAFQRLNEVGAFTVSDEGDGVLALDCTPMAAGVVILLRRLIELESGHTGATPEQVVSDLRAYLVSPEELP